MNESEDSAANVLVVDDIHKTFGSGKKQKEVLKGLSFEIAPGQVLALLGANGAGKTTLVNILSTLLEATCGRAEICGFDVKTHPRKVREVISLTGQFAAVDAELTGRENLVFFSRLRGMSRKAAKARADELLAEFRLSDAADQLVGKYSGGMRRRLDIAASLVVKPKLLFLDEPTTGLDPLSRRELWETVDQLRESNVSVLLTTQYLDEAERLADNIVMIRDGKKILEGLPSQIRQQFGAPFCQLQLDSAAEAARASRELLPARLGIEPELITVDGLSLSFASSRGVADLKEALECLQENKISVISAGLNAPSLDDVFLGMAFGDEGADVN